MTKAALRNIYRQKRNGISPKERSKWSDLLLINFQKLDLPYIRCVHSYLAVYHRNEIDTQHILRYLEFSNPGLQISVPKVNIETGQMEHYIYNDDTELMMNKFGIAEPVDGEKIAVADIDLVLTPLIAFDKNGYRVGYGKGFYDKFLHQCRSDVIKIGLSFFDAEEVIDYLSQFDIPLNCCVTPQTIYRF
jgi:5-formyltetrahydrofolate cyclo-ligase